MKKKKLILVVAILTLIMVVIGATYAYFVAQTGTGQSANINVQAGTTDSLKFEVTNDLNIYASVENFTEGQDNLSKDTNLKATLKPNNATNEATYNYYVYLDISKNELEYTTEDNKPELLLKVTKPDGTELTTIDGLEYKSVVNNKGEEVTGFDITTKKELITIADNYEIHASGSELTQEWNIEIILVNLGIDQNKNTNKKIEAEAKIQEEEIIGFVELLNAVHQQDAFDSLSYFEDIGTSFGTGRVVFENSAIVHDDTDKYDFSKLKDESIMGYGIKLDKSAYYYDDFYINSSKKMTNTDFSFWFAALNYWGGGPNSDSLKEIVGIENIDTSLTTNMARMFYNCRGLTSLNLKGFNTSKVTNMSGMFQGSVNITELDLSSFNTSQVTDMSEMFNNYVYQLGNLDSKLIVLNLSSFNTSRVTNMYNMFAGCSSLTNLDVSNFDTSNVTNMSGMFGGTSGLTVLDISNFDTSQVTSMSSMFSGASGLTALDLSNFDTSKVTAMYNMFSGASGLTALDLSNFDTSKVTGMAHMFEECSSLIELDLSNMTFNSVSWYDDMFSGVPNNIHIKVKDEAAKAFIEARLAEANITEGVVEIVNK